MQEEKSLTIIFFFFKTDKAFSILIFNIFETDSWKDEAKFFSKCFSLWWVWIILIAAVFNPEKEKLQFLVFVRGDGNWKEWGSPPTAFFSKAGPPG